MKSCYRKKGAHANKIITNNTLHKGWGARGILLYDRAPLYEEWINLNIQWIYPNPLDKIAGRLVHS